MTTTRKKFGDGQVIINDLYKNLVHIIITILVKIATYGDIY